MFGADLPRELRARYKVPNHGLYELFLDILVLASDEGKDLCGIGVNLFDHEKSAYGLLTKCSERFRRQGYVRIPPEHVPSLERDFNMIITGTAVLIRFLLKACRGLCNNLKDFINTRILELAADKVFEGLFCKSWDDIRALSGLVEEAVDEPSGKLIGISSQQLTKPGSALFSILYQVGASFKRDVSRNDVVQMVDEPLQALLSQVPVAGRAAPVMDFLIETLGADMDALPYWLLRRKLRKLGGGSKGAWKDQSPILAFLSGLLLDAEGDIARAREIMRKGLRPLIIVVGSAEGEEDCKLKEMFAAGRIDLYAVPAIAESYPEDLRRSKELDKNTLLVRIDGYNLKENPDVAAYTVQNGPKGRLNISINIRADTLPGTHHLFVDIKDRNGVHSEYIDRKIVVGRANPGGSSLKTGDR